MTIEQYDAIYTNLVQMIRIQERERIIKLLEENLNNYPDALQHIVVLIQAEQRPPSKFRDIDQA